MFRLDEILSEIGFGKEIYYHKKSKQELADYAINKRIEVNDSMPNDVDLSFISDVVVLDALKSYVKCDIEYKKNLISLLDVFSSYLFTMDGKSKKQYYRIVEVAKKSYDEFNEAHVNLGLCMQDGKGYDDKGTHAWINEMNKIKNILYTKE